MFYNSHAVNKQLLFLTESSIKHEAFYLARPAAESGPFGLYILPLFLILYLLPRDAMLVRYLLWPSVRLSVSVSACHKSVYY